MSDLFQDGVPIEFIGKVWRVMEEANWHTYQVLTKRPDNMSSALQTLAPPVLPNVWLGTSVGDFGKVYSERIEQLRRLRLR